MFEHHSLMRPAINFSQAGDLHVIVTLLELRIIFHLPVHVGMASESSCSPQMASTVQNTVLLFVLRLREPVSQNFANLRLAKP